MVLCGDTNAFPKTCFLFIFFWHSVVLLCVRSLKQKRGSVMHLKLSKFGIVYLLHSSFTRRCYGICCFPALLGVYNNLEVIAEEIAFVGFIAENFEEIFSVELSSTLFYVEHEGICMGSIFLVLLVSLSHSFLTRCLQISRTKFVTEKKKKNGFLL